MKGLRTHWHNPTHRYGVGVSGGGDSLALLHLLVGEFGPQNFHAILVNHGWNESFAKRSAAAAQKLCDKLGVPLSIVVAAGGKPKTNPEAAARTHRYAAFAQVATQENLDAILLGHTRTDNVEQFLMRAARGSGLTGLSGIPPEGHHATLRIIRPMLNLNRDDLRAYLKKHKVQWVEDPGNAASTRGKIRAKLKGDWLNEEAVAASIAALQRAEDALEAQTLTLMKQIHFPSKIGNPEWSAERDWLLNLPTELALRLLAKLVKDDADTFAPRTSKRQTLLNAIAQKPKGAATLGAYKIEWQQGALKATKLKS
jgi:tRNA(Ile)-lysidine synthase